MTDTDPRTYAETYLEEAQRALGELDVGPIESLVAALAQLRERHGRLFVVGLGGSAAHASHAAADLRMLCGVQAFCPTDNIAEFTARMNDDGSEETIAGWLIGSCMGAGDGLLVLSVGGGDEQKGISTAIVRAIAVSEEMGAYRWCIVGRDGGLAATKCEIVIRIPVVSWERVTAHTESVCASVWHLAATHPALALRRPKWESTE